jgi:hypothetical protein
VFSNDFGDAEDAGPRSGMAKRVARGGLESVGSGWREEEAQKAEDSDAPSGDPATDTRKAWSPKGDMTSRSFDMSQGVVGGGGRRGVAGSLVVRGLCQNVTESAVLSLFDQVASGDGVGEGEGGIDGIGIKSVRLLPLNRRYPSRVAYVNFASAAALHAGLRLDGMVPVWNLGSPLQVLRQESPGDSTQDSKAPEGGERTRYGELHTLTPRAMPQFKEHISPLTPAPAAPAAGGASKSGSTASRGEGGGLPTSSLFGISPVAPRSMGPFVSPFAKGPPTVDDGGTTLVTPSVDSTARAPSSAAAELGSLSKQAHLHVPGALFGDAAGGHETDSGASIWRGNASGLGARTDVSGSAKMDFMKPTLSRCLLLSIDYNTHTHTHTHTRMYMYVMKPAVLRCLLVVC